MENLKNNNTRFTVYFVASFTLFALEGCTITKEQDRTKSKGIILFSKYNTDYFFPLKADQVNFELEDFMSYNYDTGFVVIWYQAKWRDDILGSYSTDISNDQSFKKVAFVQIDYLKPKPHSLDSVYSFAFDYFGEEKYMIYDNKDREFKGITGLK
ncbi:hypothetical protein FNH22_10295 [Fulvivirga sp. M361]|uniref:hypothetical protein n=1 Tax=Fulvivirga sp. M361 TaxID=2594266 RepID=UPI00117AC260|nr:hypothetical protein [Fulvivirga sp. M361]TRX59534.1 hypothetical protein FNH22_10295 [Fulvivirga sp. M361]